MTGSRVDVDGAPIAKPRRLCAAAEMRLWIDVLFHVFCLAMVALCYNRLYKAQTAIKGMSIEGREVWRGKEIYSYGVAKGYEPDFSRDVSYCSPRPGSDTPPPPGCQVWNTTDEGTPPPVWNLGSLTLGNTTDEG